MRQVGSYGFPGLDVLMAIGSSKTSLAVSKLIVCFLRSRALRNQVLIQSVVYAALRNQDPDVSGNRAISDAEEAC